MRNLEDLWAGGISGEEHIDGEEDMDTGNPTLLFDIQRVYRPAAPTGK